MIKTYKDVSISIIMGKTAGGIGVLDTNIHAIVSKERTGGYRITASSGQRWSLVKCMLVMYLKKWLESGVDLGTKERYEEI